MRKINQDQVKEFLNSKEVAVLVLTRENCPSCDSVKKEIMPRVKAKLHDVDFAEFEAVNDVYPVNELMQQFNFKTVPTTVIYKNSVPLKIVKGVTFSKEFIKTIQSVM